MSSKNKRNIKRARSTPKWYYIILVLLPFFFILVIEIFLKLIGYGTEYREWIDLDNKYEILNPDIAYKYFSGIENIPFSTESFLLKEKPDNLYRIIALGASSGAGYPYQSAGSFTKYLRKALPKLNSEIKFEVANISMAAINSFTILDLLPGVLEKDPDLILVYLGHNEFYGALGVGSNQSIANSTGITNFILKLKEYKIYQLIESIIASIQEAAVSNKRTPDGTLMSKIAGEKLIALNSDLFNNGIHQFESNLEDIINKCKKRDVPVIIGTLTSNLKDLPPFNSVETNGYDFTKIVFNEANEELNNGSIQDADSLYRLAKDLDGLRFRAPEVFNDIILKLASRNNCFVADIDSALNKNSSGGIVGNDMIIDHLHPNLLGYQIMGKTFLNEIVKNKLVKPNEEYTNLEIIDKQVRSNYNFTSYDSTISDFRIKILKNDWPFNRGKKKVSRAKLITSNSKEGQLANDVLEGRLSRLDARLKLSDHYLKNEDYTNHVNELLAMSIEFPSEKSRINQQAENLIKKQKYEYVGKLLNASYDIEPDDFNTKWLGIMNMSNGNLQIANKYLQLSNQFNSSDPQVLFNLSGIYYQKHDFEQAYTFILQCLKVSPNYKNATLLKTQIENKLKN